MGVWKKSFSANQRSASSRPATRELISEARRSRRAEVESATDSPPGALVNDGVKSGGVEDEWVSEIAKQTSGVPVRGINTVVLGLTQRVARLIGRAPSSPNMGVSKSRRRK